MKRFSLNCCFLLIAGQLNIFDIPFILSNAVNPLAQKKVSVQVDARIYFGDQDEETYSIKTEFYLLDKSLVEILKSRRFKPEFSDGEQQQVTDEDCLEAAAKAFTAENDQESGAVAFLIKDAMAKYQRAAMHTNEFGKGKFERVTTGSYYLFGIGSTEDEVFVWHSPVEIRSSDYLIEINQDGAAVIFAIDR